MLTDNVAGLGDRLEFGDRQPVTATKLLTKTDEITMSSQTIAKPNVSRRLSSYEKLKQGNAKLEQDIYNLVRNADKIEGTQTRFRYEMHYKMIDNFWFGDTTKSLTKFSGILGCLLFWLADTCL